MNTYEVPLIRDDDGTHPDVPDGISWAGQPDEDNGTYLIATPATLVGRGKAKLPDVAVERYPGVTAADVATWRAGDE